MALALGMGMIATFAVADSVKSPTIISKELNANELAVISENSLLAVSSPLFRGKQPTETLAKIEGQNEAINSLDEILECLAEVESSGNELAFNPEDTDGLPAIGLLQFKQMTWERNCEPLGLDNIWSGEQQKECAKVMIQNGMIGAWPTRRFCKIP